MRKRIVFIVLFALAAAVWGAETLTLEKLIASGLQNNLDLQAAAEKIAARMDKVRKSESVLLPMAMVSASYTRLGIVPEMTIPGMGTYRFANENALSLGLGLRYPLFNWGMGRDQIKLEEMGLDLEKLNLDLARRSFIYQLSALYFSALQLDENAAILVENISILEDLLEISRRRFLAGYIPEYQVLQVQVNAETLKGQLIDIRRLVNEQLITIKETCGLELEAEVLLAACRLEMPGEADTVDGWLALAEANRHEFKILHLQISILEKNRDIVRKSQLPLLNAGGNVELKNGVMPDVGAFKFNWNAGVSLTFSLFDGGAARAETRVLSRQVSQLNLNLAQLRRLTASRILKDMDALAASEKKIALEKAKRGLAKKSLELATRSYEEARATYLDVLNAQSAYNLCQIGLSTLQAQKSLAILQLRLDSGTLK